MRIAYLIIAHNEWEILKLLISKLDNEDNDLYLHIDKKIKDIPKFNCNYSRLYILSNRIDVRWGTVKQIECEYALFREAQKNGPYDFLILISGVHLPLKSNHEINSWLENYKGKTIFSNLRKSGEYQETLKLRRYNFFLTGYQANSRIVKVLSQFLWKLSVYFQKSLNIQVNKGYKFYWANNWAAFSPKAIDYLIRHEKQIIKKYRFSFCGDEYFAPSELLCSPISDEIICNNNLLFCEINKANATIFSVEIDYPELCKTDYIFARKFGTKK